MQRRRIEIRAVRPHKRVDFGVYASLIEKFSVTQLAVELSLENRSEIYGLLRSIVEL